MKNLNTYRVQAKESEDLASQNKGADLESGCQSTKNNVVTTAKTERNKCGKHKKCIEMFS